MENSPKAKNVFNPSTIEAQVQLFLPKVRSLEQLMDPIIKLATWELNFYTNFNFYQCLTNSYALNCNQRLRVL